MRLLIIFGSILLLGVYADSAEPVLNDITVNYAQLTKDAPTTLSLCGVIGITESDKNVAQLTIEDEGDLVEVKNVFGKLQKSCYAFDISKYPDLMEKPHNIILKITVPAPLEPPGEETVHEFNGIFTFKETVSTTIETTYFNTVKVLQFKKGKVSHISIEDQTTNVKEYDLQCDGTGADIICVQPIDEDSIIKLTYIDTYEGDTIPYLYEIKENLAGVPCDGVVDVSTVYDNDNGDGFTFSGKDVANTYAVSDSEVFYNIQELIKPSTIPDMFVLINENICEEMPVKVRDMDFLKPFDNTVEVSWLHDDPKTHQNKYYLEVKEVTGDTLIKNLHIDCSQDTLTTCIAYVFDDSIQDSAQIKFELSESVESVKPPTPGKMKTKETYEVPNPNGKKSLKALNLNQFEINWNTKQGKLCLEDSLFKKAQKSQYKYELVIGFDEGNWKKHIANYNDESTICFNDFEVTEFIENKLGVHFLVMKRESDTNQIVASDMITTDLIVPEISEVNDETISLEFENLNSPFLIRDEKTKQIISKNEKKIHNLAFLKSSHEKKSIFNRNLVLETRKEHTQMKVHFKIPQKVNAA